MIRSAEFFGYERIYIYDANGLLDPPKNKASRADMNHLARVWTAGAIEHIEIIQIPDIETYLKAYSGRIIATVIDDDASPLETYRPLHGDLLVVGPEKEGLPGEFITNCNEKYYLKNKGKTDCLNVSVMLGLLLYHVQLSSQ